MFGTETQIRHERYRRLIVCSMALVVLLAMGTGLTAAQTNESIGDAGEEDTVVNESIEESVETETETVVDGPAVDDEDSDFSTDGIVDDFAEETVSVDLSEDVVDETILGADDDETSVTDDTVPESVTDDVSDLL